MANRAAAALVLRDGDREALTRLARSTAGRAGLAQRARIVLLAAEGASNTAIADKVGVSRPTVLDWRGRYERKGIVGLADDPRSGWPKQIDHGRIEPPRCFRRLETLGRLESCQGTRRRGIRMS